MTSTPHPTPAFQLRRARFSDLPGAARTCSLAFFDDVLFGGIIHPHRTSYPRDVDTYWYRRFIVNFWDWSHVFLVTTETASVSGAKGKEVITGVAHSSRMVPKPRENYLAGWELAWWDPIRLASAVLDLCSPNRAASHTDEDIIERSDNCIGHIWTGDRSHSWYLESLAVHPDYQRRGQGRALVKWGLDQARKEGIACSVIAADGKERFYQACGFTVGPVGRAGEGESNPTREVPGGLLFFQDREGVVIPEREDGSWTYGNGVFDWNDWRKKMATRGQKSQ